MLQFFFICDKVAFLNLNMAPKTFVVYTLLKYIHQMKSQYNTVYIFDIYGNSHYKFSKNRIDLFKQNCLYIHERKSATWRQFVFTREVKQIFIPPTKWGSQFLHPHACQLPIA